MTALQKKKKRKKRKKTKLQLYSSIRTKTTMLTAFDANHNNKASEKMTK